MGDRSQKPKSRFALQREQEALARTAALKARSGTERFTLDLDGEEAERESEKLPRLVGEVLERESDGTVPLPPSLSAPVVAVASHLTGKPTGFPQPSRVSLHSSTPTPSKGTLCDSISQENERIIEGMSAAAIAEEQRQIREEMGLSPDIIQMLLARGGRTTPPAALVAVAAPKERGDREVRFVEPQREEADEEEGTPEYIRRHFFPDEPESAQLDWMRPSTSPSMPTSSSHTFDLAGNLLAASASTDDPHQGQDHHSSSSSAFSIASLLSLLNSSVAGQRSTSFQILTRILRAPPTAALLGPKTWGTLRVDLGRKAARGVGDRNVGVAAAAVELLGVIFELELAAGPRQPVLQLKGKEIPEDLLTSFLSADPYPTFSKLLNFALLPLASLETVLHVLCAIVRLEIGQPKSLAVEELLACEGLLEGVEKRFIAIPWPSSSPSLAGLDLLLLLARSSRARAHALWERKLFTAPTRFLSIAPWSMAAGDREVVGAAMGRTMMLLSVLGRYGLGGGLRTSLSDIFSSLSQHYSSLFASNSASPMNSGEAALCGQWLELLETWTTLAMDPHATGHEILWSQVDWAPMAIQAHRHLLTAASAGGSLALLEKIWGLLAGWMEGSKLNTPWRGEVSRAWLVEQIGSDWTERGDALTLVRRMMEGLLEGQGESGLLLEAVRLSSAYEDDALPITAHLFSFEQATLRRFFATLPSLVSSSTLAAWPLVRLAVALLPFLAEGRFDATLEVIPLLRAGDEIFARQLADYILLHSPSPTLQLRPFILHQLLTPNTFISPLHPTSKDLSLTTAQRPFCSPTPLLARDWPLGVLDELLRSGSSPVFANLPTGWAGTELGLVRSALELMGMVQRGAGRIGADAIVFGLIKVFMLEMDDQAAGASTMETKEKGEEVELFRDPTVETSMLALLAPFRVDALPTSVFHPLPHSTDLAALELVSSVVSSSPFFALYTNFLSLYASISLSHPTFSLLLLPPLSMSYAADYRALFWVDNADLLPTFKQKISQVLVGAGGLAEYVGTQEMSGRVLEGYAKALLSGQVTRAGQEFLYFVAIHQLGSLLFGGEVPSELATVAKRLAGAVLADKGTVLGDLLGVKLGVPGEELGLEVGEEVEDRRERLQVLAGGGL